MYILAIACTWRNFDLQFVNQRYTCVGNPPNYNMFLKQVNSQKQNKTKTKIIENMSRTLGQISYWGRSFPSTVGFQTPIIVGLSQNVDVMLKLEVSVGPEGAEQNHHANVDEQVKGEVHADHDDFPPDRVDCHDQQCEQGEVQEPYGVAHGQDDVKAECSPAVLDEINLPHLVQEVH